MNRTTLSTEVNVPIRVLARWLNCDVIIFPQILHHKKDLCDFAINILHAVSFKNICTIIFLRQY